jgi:hypothetical protein
MCLIVLARFADGCRPALQATLLFLKEKRVPANCSIFSKGASARQSLLFSKEKCIPANCSIFSKGASAR